MPFSPVTFTDNVTPLNKATFDALQAGVIAAERTENKGVASGYASLDSGAKVPLAQLPANAAGAATVTYGASPPGSPADGDLWNFPADATNGVIWQFRYRAASASAYKWEFLGGAPAYTTFAAQENLPATASWTWVTNNCDFAAPRSGDYMCTAKSVMSCGTAAAHLYIGVANASVSATPPGSTGSAYLVTVSTNVNVVAVTKLTAVTAGQTLRVVFYSSVGTGSSSMRDLSVTPVRVS